MAYEDFTGFTEVDPDGELTVTTNKVHVIDQNLDGDSYVYKDYGENHFAGDFIHKFKLIVTSGISPDMGTWCISNISTGFSDFDITTVSIGIYSIEDTFLLSIDKGQGGEEGYVESCILELNTKYYLNIERSGTEYMLTIRTGSHSGDIVDSITLDAGELISFRYLYAQYEYEYY